MPTHKKKVDRRPSTMQRQEKCASKFGKNVSLPVTWDRLATNNRLFYTQTSYPKISNHYIAVGSMVINSHLKELEKVRLKIAASARNVPTNADKETPARTLSAVHRFSNTRISTSEDDRNRVPICDSERLANHANAVVLFPPTFDAEESPRKQPSQSKDRRKSIHSIPIGTAVSNGVGENGASMVQIPVVARPDNVSSAYAPGVQSPKKFLQSNVQSNSNALSSPVHLSYPRPIAPRPNDSRPIDPRPSDQRPNAQRPIAPRPIVPRPNDSRPIDPRPIDPRLNGQRPTVFYAPLTMNSSIVPTTSVASLAANSSSPTSVSTPATSAPRTASLQRSVVKVLSVNELNSRADHAVQQNNNENRPTQNHTPHVNGFKMKYVPIAPKLPTQPEQPAQPEQPGRPEQQGRRCGENVGTPEQPNLNNACEDNANQIHVTLIKRQGNELELTLAQGGRKMTYDSLTESQRLQVQKSLLDGDVWRKMLHHVRIGLPSKHTLDLFRLLLPQEQRMEFFNSYYAAKGLQLNN